MVGYYIPSKIYRCFDSLTHKIHLSRDIEVIDNHLSYIASPPKPDHNLLHLSSSCSLLLQTPLLFQSFHLPLLFHHLPPTQFSPLRPILLTLPHLPCLPLPTFLLSPPTLLNILLFAAPHDHLFFHDILTTFVGITECLTAVTSELVTFYEALHHPCWVLAMQIKIKIFSHLQYLATSQTTPDTPIGG